MKDIHKIKLWQFAIKFSQYGEHWYHPSIKSEKELMQVLFNTGVAISVGRDCYKYDKIKLQNYIDNLNKELFPNSKPNDIVAVTTEHKMWRLNIWTADNSHYYTENSISCSDLKESIHVKKTIIFYRNIHSTIWFSKPSVQNLIDAIQKSPTKVNKFNYAKVCLDNFNSWYGNICLGTYPQGKDPNYSF